MKGVYVFPGGMAGLRGFFVYTNTEISEFHFVLGNISLVMKMW